MDRIERLVREETDEAIGELFESIFFVGIGEFSIAKRLLVSAEKHADMAGWIGQNRKKLRPNRLNGT